MRKKLRILVIGSINMDLILRTQFVPAAGETCLGDTYGYSPGGKGANQAAAAAQLGADVSFIGKVGADVNGSRLREMQQSFGVVTEYLQTDPETATGLAVVMVEPDGGNRILVFPGSNARLSPEDVVPVIEQGVYDALIVQFEIPQETVIAACRTALERKITVVVDAGPAVSFPLHRIAGITVLSPNETETAALCGLFPDSEEKALLAAKRLMKLSNAKFIVIKRGARGAYVYGSGIAQNFDAPRVKAVDTTAAGDAFTAAFTIRMVGTGDIVDAVRYANFAGAFTVMKAGAQTALPTSDELEHFMKQYDIVQ